ncbi:hypothetical protein HGH93_23575 [Chitinophaga polysaccharea]|uniref:hypothetical protein n=1 Tax=Chitinophaga polysaccharea TaxID=1293035 RepID=UPI0014552911|nr:hypothetical protein [Chitinophaga polysaccharea]NLR61102.1 hypothetical protein [Chitinophaga polysaccharea]
MEEEVEIKNKYKIIPLTDEGELRDNEAFKLKSPRRMIMLGQSLMGKTYNVINIPKFLIMDADKETDYYPWCRNYVKVANDEVERYYLLENNVVIPAAIYELVMEMRTANRMDLFEKFSRKIERSKDATKKKQYFRYLKKLINDMPFAVLVADSLTSLQKLNHGAALYGYNLRVKPESRKTDIKHTDQWGGVSNIRPNFAGILEFIETASPYTLYTAHIKEKKNVLEKGPEDLVPLDIALEGIQSSSITSRMAAVGIFYRNKEGCFLDFVKRDETDIGARPPHMANRIIKIAEPLKKQGEPSITFWNKIYLELRFKTA